MRWMGHVVRMKDKKWILMGGLSGGREINRPDESVKINGCRRLTWDK